MFTTIDEVNDLTGYEVTQEQIIMAQAIIESYLGRVEATFGDPNDLMILGRATAYQAAYMKNDPLKVFEQISAKSISQFGSSVTFKDGDDASPFVAPLARLACRSLAGSSTRSVHTGPVFDSPRRGSWWTT